MFVSTIRWILAPHLASLPREKEATNLLNQFLFGLQCRIEFFLFNELLRRVLAQNSSLWNQSEINFFGSPMKLQIVVSWEICELNGMPLMVFGILLPRGASTLGLFGTRLVTVTGKLQYTNRQSFLFRSRSWNVPYGVSVWTYLNMLIEVRLPQITRKEGWLFFVLNSVWFLVLAMFPSCPIWKIL